MTRATFGWLLVWVVAGVGLEGQTGDSLSVTVFDANTGQPIQGVALELRETDLRSVTDSAGTARFDLPTGEYTAEAEHFGYHAAVVVVSNQDSKRVGFVMHPKPVTLDPIVVRSRIQRADDHAERRRESFADIRTEAFDFTDIASVVTTDIVRRLAPEAGVPLVECDGGSDAPDCWNYRGFKIPVCVLLDEGELHGGLTTLRSLPIESIGRIEFYLGTGMVRAYTIDFLERSSERPEAFMPLFDALCPR